MISAKKEVNPTYTAFSPFMYSLDTFLPIINFGQKDYWWPQPTVQEPYCARTMETNFWRGPWNGCYWSHIAARWVLTTIPSLFRDHPRVYAGVSWLSAPPTIGHFLRGYRWLHIAIGWFLITVGVAGVTGLVRKE